MPVYLLVATNQQLPSSSTLRDSFTDVQDASVGALFSDASGLIGVRRDLRASKVI